MRALFTRLWLGLLLLVLTLPVSLGLSLLAQGTNISQTQVRDVSVYPAPDSLPGKGPAQTWSDFAKIWAHRHAEWRQTRDQENGAVVFLGDSITQGWSTLKRDFPALQVANRGIGGDTTRGVLYRLDPDVLSLKPAAVVLLIGTNDIGLGADPEDVAANIREIVAELRRSNAYLPIVLCKVMPRSDTQPRPVAKLKQLNGLIDDIGKSGPYLAVCDTWSIYADAQGDCKVEEFPDRLHPNSAGYAKWTTALSPILNALKVQTHEPSTQRH